LWQRIMPLAMVLHVPALVGGRSTLIYYLPTALHFGYKVVLWPVSIPPLEELSLEGKTKNIKEELL